VFGLSSPAKAGAAIQSTETNFKLITFSSFCQVALAKIIISHYNLKNCFLKIRRE